MCGMRLAGGVLVVVLVMGISLLTISDLGPAEARGRKERKGPRVVTDGRLRPGHLETIWVSGFPGKGVTQVAFFPTAICEDGCGSSGYGGGRTDARGVATFQVRVPGTFIDHRNRYVYFRDGERINLNVTWEGSDHSFDVGYARPEPIIVRTHGRRHD